MENVVTYKLVRNVMLQNDKYIEVYVNNDLRHVEPDKGQTDLEMITATLTKNVSETEIKK